MSTRRGFIAGAGASLVMPSIGKAGLLVGDGSGGGGGGGEGGFNGGKSQLVFNYPQTGRVFPYMNALKGAQRWDLVDNSGTPNPNSLNDNGYPVSISNGGVKTTFSIPSSTERPGNWRLRWIGTGRVTVNGATTSIGTDGDYTFSPGTTNPTLSIINSTDITHVEMFHADDEALIDAGEMWSTLFLETLAALNPGVLRFLDWNYSNENNITKFRHWKPIDYAYWAGEHIGPPSCYAGQTTNSGNNYSVSAPSDWEGLIDKALVICEFNATASSHLGCTLDVGTTGPKEIRAQSGAILSGADRAPTINKSATLIYDSAMDCWLKWGGDSFRGDYFILDGIPAAACLDLCTKVGAHPWFVIPYLCAEPQTDWIDNLSDLLIANGPSWMVPRYEVVPNETWNPTQGFTATYYAPLRAGGLWPTQWTLPIVPSTADDTSARHNWVGKAASIQAEFLSTKYGGDRSKYRAIVGVQTHGGKTQANDRLAASVYVARDAGDPAYSWVTHIGLANYYRDTYTVAQRNTAGDAYVAADAAGKLALATDFVNSTLVDLEPSPNGQYQFAVARLHTTLVPEWLDWAQAYDSRIGATFYEGGWSPDYLTAAQIATYPNWQNVNALFAGSRMVAELEDIAFDSYTGIDAIVDADFPSHYYMGGVGVWALWDPNIYYAPSPQVFGIELFNAQ